MARHPAGNGCVGERKVLGIFALSDGDGYWRHQYSEGVTSGVEVRGTFSVQRNACWSNIPPPRFERESPEIIRTLQHAYSSGLGGSALLSGWLGSFAQVERKLGTSSVLSDIPHPGV